MALSELAEFSRQAGTGFGEARKPTLSRSIRGMSEILADLEDAGVAFRSATEPFDTATPAGRMMVQMLAVFAEFERATIIDRVINGMERKAARGECELAPLERAITKDEDAIDRYLTAFENGAMDEAVCSPRVQQLAAELTEQRAWRDELALLLDEATTPDIPDTTVLETLRGDIEAAANTGSVEALRRVMQTFVHRVEITSRDAAEPRFVIPGDLDVPYQRSAARVTGRGYGAKGSRTGWTGAPGSVPTSQYTNSKLLVSGSPVSVGPVHAGAHRVQIRIDVINGVEVCRVDVPASSKPIWTRFKKQDAVLFVRRNNSTRQVPAAEVDQFLAERFG